MSSLDHFNVFGYNSTIRRSYVFTVTYLLLLFFLIYLFVTAKAALPKKSLVFAARQIVNNLSPISKVL